MSGSLVTTIVADFGGVLSTPLAPAFGAVHEQLGIPMAALGSAMAALTAERGSNPLHDLESGGIEERTFFELLAARLSADLGREVLLHEYADRYWAALRPNEALLARLLALRRDGYRMGLLTNNIREWEPRWRAMLPADELFDVVVDSARVGLRKPDAAIYALTAERLGVPGAQIVFLDDVEENCAAARAAGWSTVRFESTEQTLAELGELLAARGAPGAGPAAAAA